MNNYQTQKKRNVIALLAAYFAANVIFIMSPAINVMATEIFPAKAIPLYFSCLRSRLCA